jgi:integrase
VARLVKQLKTYHVGPDGKRCPKDAAGARKVTEESSKWYGQGIPGMPASKRVPLATHKRVAEQMLAKLVEKAERGENGMVNLDAGRQPLAPLVAEFEQSLSRKGDGKHARYAAGCVRKVLAGAALVTLADLRSPESATKVEAAVWALTEGEGAVSGPTAHRTGMHARQFARWLWRRKKLLDHDPLGGVDLPAQTGDGKRRALAPAELASLVDAADNSGRVIRGLTGPERAALYLTAAATGFRSGELAALEPDHFRLDADPPVVTLPAKYTKNRKDATQPLPPPVVARLRPLLAAVATGDKVWAGSWVERSADVFREDLAAANVPEVVNGEHAVFHSLRHTYATMLGRVATVKVTQELSRHSTPTLTIGRYGHTDMGEKAEAVGRLPLPGSGNVGPFAHLSRAELEAVAEGLWGVLGGLCGSVLVTRRVTPAGDSEGDVLRLPDTNGPGGESRPSRRIA